MMLSEMSCMPLLKKVGMLYKESGDMHLRHKLHYKLIST